MKRQIDYRNHHFVLAFFLSLIFPTAIGIHGYINLKRVIHKFEHVVQINMGNLEKMTEMKAIVQNLSLNINNLFSLGPNRQSEITKSINNLKTEIAKYEIADQGYKNIPFVAGEAKLYLNVLNHWTVIKTRTLELILLFEKEDSSPLVKNMYSTNYNKEIDDYLKSLDDLIHFQGRESKKWVNDAEMLSKSSMITSLSLLTFSLLISLTLTILFSLLYRKLQESIKIRDTFLSVASHELKTPLTTLLLQVQSRIRQFEKGNRKAFSEEKLKDYFLFEIKQLNRLNNLIDDMLDLSRIRMSKLSLIFSPVELDSLAREHVERFRPQFAEMSTELSYHSNGEVWITSDSFRLEQVMSNLLSNALKYGRGLPTKVEVRADYNSGKAYFSVTDQGIGISKENQEKVFYAFERGAAPSGIGGLGLGLSIAKDLAIALGGDIHLESKLGVGSTFTLELPIKTREGDFHPPPLEKKLANK